MKIVNCKIKEYNSVDYFLLFAFLTVFWMKNLNGRKEMMENVSSRCLNG